MTPDVLHTNHVQPDSVLGGVGYFCQEPIIPHLPLGCIEITINILHDQDKFQIIQIVPQISPDANNSGQGSNGDQI
jgi:hypothetical protein